MESLNPITILTSCISPQLDEDVVEKELNQNDKKLMKRINYARGINCASDMIVENIETNNDGQMITTDFINSLVIALIAGRQIELDNPLARKVLKIAERPDYDFAEIACCVADKVKKRGGDKIEIYSSVISVLANRNVRSFRNTTYPKSQLNIIADIYLSNLDSMAKKVEHSMKATASEHQCVEISANEFEPQKTDYINGIPVNIKWSQLSDIQQLAGNQHTLVYTANFDEKLVVVKTINSEYENDVAKKDLEAELAMLSKLNHPNIIKLYGAGYHQNGCRFVVIEYCQGGTFLKLVGKNKCKVCQPYLRAESTFKMTDALIIARSIADAMSYLHCSAIDGSMILHRDLKPDNIGITKEGEVKLLDFGLARIVENASPKLTEVYKMTGLTGTLCYMSPEVATLQPYNQKADVFSFGILLWQLVTSQEPYCCVKNESLYRELFVNNLRPPVNKKWPKDLILLMQQCWSVNVEERPSFQQVIDSLDSVVSSLSKKRKSLPWARVSY